MLEILLLYGLGKNIAEKAENQGRGGALFVIILIVLWFLGEIVGAVVGMIVTGEKLYAYLFALIGAAVGAVLAYTFLAVLPLFESAMQERPKPRRRRRPRPRRAEEREEEGRSKEKRRKDEDDEVYEDLAVEEAAAAAEPADPEGYEVVEDNESGPRRKRMPRGRLDG
jgi:hypothetical protein